MKRYPKLIQADKRGQIVIPKEVRKALDIDETTGFFVYVIPDEGILLKQVDPEPLQDTKAMENLQEYAEKLGIPVEKLEQTIAEYKAEKEDYKTYEVDIPVIHTLDWCYVY